MIRIGLVLVGLVASLGANAQQVDDTTGTHPIVVQMNEAAMTWPDHGVVTFDVRLADIDAMVAEQSQDPNLPEEQQEMLRAMQELRFEGSFNFATRVSDVTIHGAPVMPDPVRAQGLEQMRSGLWGSLQGTFMSLALHSGSLLMEVVDVSEDNGFTVVSTPTDVMRIHQPSGLPTVLTGQLQGMTIEQQYSSWAPSDYGALTEELVSVVNGAEVARLRFSWVQHDGFMFLERVDLVRGTTTSTFTLSQVRWQQ